MIKVRSAQPQSSLGRHPVAQICIFIILFLMLILPAQAKGSITLTAQDFSDRNWTICIADGYLTFISSEGDTYQPVAVQSGFSILAESRKAKGETLPVPDGMADEYKHLLGDALTDGAICADIGVNQTEIIMLLVLPDGKTRLRIAEWKPETRSYIFLDNDSVPKVSWFDTIHFGDGEVSLHWMATEVQRNNSVEAFDAAERSVYIRRRFDGGWYLQDLIEFGEIDTAISLGWKYIEDQGLSSSGSNDGYYYGIHPWNEFENVNLSQLPFTLEEAITALDQSNWALVNNPNPNDRLHLRTKPDRSSESLGKFYNRTPIFVTGSKDEWSSVLIGNEGMEGWVMTKYLTFGKEMDGVKSAFPSRTGLTFRETDIPHPVYRLPDIGAHSAWEAKGTYDEFIIGIYGDDWYILINSFGQTGYVPSAWYWDGNG